MFNFRENVDEEFRRKKWGKMEWGMNERGEEWWRKKGGEIKYYGDDAMKKLGFYYTSAGRVKYRFNIILPSTACVCSKA